MHLERATHLRAVASGPASPCVTSVTLQAQIAPCLFSGREGHANNLLNDLKLEDGPGFRIALRDTARVLND